MNEKLFYFEKMNIVCVAYCVIGTYSIHNIMGEIIETAGPLLCALHGCISFDC